MNELVENLQLSQPSISNMVRILQEKQLIQEIGNDLSSGGRCPTRFALNENNYFCLLYTSQRVHILDGMKVKIADYLCWIEIV